MKRALLARLGIKPAKPRKLETPVEVKVDDDLAGKLLQVERSVSALLAAQDAGPEQHPWMNLAASALAPRPFRLKDDDRSKLREELQRILAELVALRKSIEDKPS